MWSWFLDIGLIAATVGSIAHIFPNVLLGGRSFLTKGPSFKGVKITLQRVAGVWGGIVVGMLAYQALV